MFKAQVQKVLKMPHGPKKQQAKKDLLNEVMAWALDNREQAIAELN